jgi:uncharacterized membrane protein
MISLAALLLRLPGLGSQLWLDEILSLLDSYRAPLVQIFTVYPSDSQHPLYALAASAVRGMFGESPLVLRLPSLVFGVATVPMLYVFGRELGPRRQALAAALLLAVSYHHVWFSQNARGYAMLAFWALASSHLLLRALDAPSAGRWGAYAVVAALGVYTHMTMVFLVVAHTLVALPTLFAGREKRRGRTLAWLGLGGATLLTLLLYLPILDDLTAYFLAEDTSLPVTATTASALEEAADGLAAGLAAKALSAAGVAGVRPVASLAAIVVVAALAVGAVSFLRSDRRALLLFVAPAALIVVISLTTRDMLRPRYVFLLIGFGLLVLVRGLTTMGARLGGRRAETALVALVAVASLASLPTLWRLPKQDFEGAARWIERNVPAGETVAVAGIARVVYRDHLAKPWPVFEPGDGEAKLALQRTATSWLVFTMPHYLEISNPEVAAAVESCSARHSFPGTLGRGDVYVCELAPLAATTSEQAP